MAYVIGNSKFYGHVLPSDEILAKIFGHFGFALERIDRMRRQKTRPASTRRLCLCDANHYQRKSSGIERRVADG